MSTNTTMPPPVCENCGRDKQATYICDPCCDKLNAITRATREERDALRAELARVKAESLRVVPDGEARDMGELVDPCVFKYETEIWRIIGGVGIIRCVSIDGRKSIGISRHISVQPVRLERWEDE